MESYNYESFITDTVEQMLPRFSSRDIGLGMIIDMSWTDYGYDETGNNKVREEQTFRKEFFILFHRPSNYTKVLVRDVTDQRNDFLYNCINPVRMNKLSDHDSCWRSDGMRWVFQTFAEAWDFFKQFGVEGRDIDPHVRYSMFKGKPTHYKIELEEIRQDDGYVREYDVVIRETLSLKKACEYLPDEE